MGSEQKIVIDTIMKTSNVLATLINDVMEISAKDNGRFPLKVSTEGFGFAVDIRNPLPDQVIGDEKRTFQVVLHMVGYLLSIFDGRGSFIFRVSSESESDGKNDKTWGLWRTDEFTSIKFEIEIIDGGSSPDGSSSAIEFSGWKHSSNENKESLSFSMCKKLVQVRILDILFIFHLLFFCTSSERNFCLIKNRIIIIGIFILALHFWYCSFLFSFLFFNVLPCDTSIS